MRRKENIEKGGKAEEEEEEVGPKLPDCSTSMCNGSRTANVMLCKWPRKTHTKGQRTCWGEWMHAWRQRVDQPNETHFGEV